MNSIIRRIRKLILVSMLLPFPTGGLCAQEMAGSVEFDEAYAQYGPGIFPAVTNMVVCYPYRVMVAYFVGTDMLFVDAVEPNDDETTLRIKKGISIRELAYYENADSIKQVSCKRQGEHFLNISGKANDGQSGLRYSFSVLMDTSTWTYKYSDSRPR